jgi:tetratricopeptide (TPR) repeat protein
MTVFLIGINCDRAIDDFNTAIKLRPSIEWYFSRGCTYEAKGDTERAKSEYAESERLAKKSP